MKPVPNSNSNSSQIALVTGATRGIGAAIAAQLLNQGFIVIGSATTAAGAEAIERDLAVHGQIHGVVLDVKDAPACDALIERLVQQHGAIHVLVNNAGIARDMLAVRLKNEDFDAVLDTNLHAVFRLCRAVIRPMIKQRYGRIINITSVVGRVGNPGQANYAASKAAVAGLSRSLAHELGSRGITVNCVAPGFIETDMTAAISSAQKEALLAQIPLGHLGKPCDVAAVVAFLASPSAAYVTGQEWHVNGGMAML